jgi:DNA-binding NtrC family response regulator
MDRLFADLARGVVTEARGFAAAAYSAAQAHPWPGNIRELRNRVERALALSSSRWLLPGDLFPELDEPAARTTSPPIATLSDVRDDAERQQIARVLAAHNGHIANTAEALGVSRTTLWEKMRRLGVAVVRPGAKGDTFSM